MTINQLFIKRPSNEILENLLEIFGYNSIDNIDEKYKFNREKLLNDNILEKFDKIKENIKSNYINCKRNSYFENLDIKKLITILRQHLKLINYKLNSEVKYKNNKKIINFNIVNLKKENDVKCIITFD